MLEHGQLIYLFDVADRWVILELLQKCQELNLFSSENHLGNLLWICHDQLREVVWVLADVGVFPVHLSEVLVDGESKEGVSLATHQSHLELIANLDLFHWHRDDTEINMDGLDKMRRTGIFSTLRSSNFHLFKSLLQTSSKQIGHFRDSSSLSDK